MCKEIVGSSCNYLFFDLTITPLRFWDIPKEERDAKKYIEKEKILRPQKRELHELPGTEMVKSETIRQLEDRHCFSG